MRQSKLISLFAALLVLTACNRGTSNEEAGTLSDKLIDMAISDMDKALERVDSAEEAGLFTVVRANTVKAMIYENAGKRRMATYFAEKAVAAEKGRAITTPADSGLYYSARWILADGAYANGEYGKSLSLARDILVFAGAGTTPKNLVMKCKALTQMADCESELNHKAEAERLFLQSVDVLMESTKRITKDSDIDPLIYTLLSLNDFYIENKMPERALPLLAKMDTAINRLKHCPDKSDWVVRMRQNHVTISKAMVYAANGQREQAETLLRKHQQMEGQDSSDKTAEGVCMTLMGRFDEAVSLFNEADSIIHTNNDLITNIYVNSLLKYKYDALQKAGRTAEALAMSDYIRQLTDSLRQQERQADVEQQQEIRLQEEEIANKRQSLIMHRIFIVAIILLLFVSFYIIRRIQRYNRLLTEKNRCLYEKIQQREQAAAEERSQLEAQPEESLTAEQQLYRRICSLMNEQKPYTDENLNRDMLAQLLGTNTKYIAQAIHECSHGESVMDFITRYRLENVARLLKTTDDTISLIGEMSGIPSRVTLSRLFRNTYGMTCREYRQVAQQK